MKNLYYFLAGVLFITLISATTVSIMTVKPAMPKQTLVFTDKQGVDYLADKIKACVKQGYVVKSIAGAKTEYYNYWIVVMEKY